MKMELTKKHITKNQCQLTFENTVFDEGVIISPLVIVINNCCPQFEDMANTPIGFTFEIK